MNTRSLRIALGFLVLAVITATAVVFGFMRTSSTPSAVRTGGDGERPAAIAAHLQKLAQTRPSLEEREGPAAAAAENIFQRAYPAGDISLAKIDGARSDAATLRKRLPQGKGKGSWVSVGPSQATYPFFPLRDINLYVPNEYVAGGRTTSIAIAPNCNMGHCRLYIGTAGGGVWRTDKALHNNPKWDYLSGPFAINSIGSITIDPNDPSGDTVYAGTGEFNACGSGCVTGVGIYKSTDAGNTWTLLGNDTFKGRAVGSIAVKPGSPNVLYAGVGRALLGASSVCCAGAITINIPGAKIWGLYKSVNGGSTWTLIHNGSTDVSACSTDPVVVATNTTPCSPRGVRRVVIDPSNPNVVYAASYARGVWRSSDNGTTWTQIKPSLNAADVSMRPEIAVNTLPNGDTRMYVGEGTSGSPTSRLFRSDSVRTGSPTFDNLTSTTIGDPSYGSFNYCGGQCWYDNTVYSPPGHPDIVYLGGSYQYQGSSVNMEAGLISNGRAVVLSTDAGVTFTDSTADATDPIHPNGHHPDEHALVTNPNNPFQYFQAGDGGVVRSSGEVTDISANCNSRPLDAAGMATCKQLLSRVPTKIESMNDGLSTLQFQSLSVSPFDSSELQGGTQDNGTWENYGQTKMWLNTMIGDGGQSGFDAVNPNFRFHTFAGQQADVNFTSGAVRDWNWISDTLFNGEPSGFYFPIISDPTVSGTMFAGLQHVMRTKTHGLGSMTLDQLRQHCNEWTGDFARPCGDWAPLGDPSAAGRLTGTAYGEDKIVSPNANNYIAAVERARGNDSTLWAATTGGRVFISKNADADPGSAVTFTRIDTASQPGRFVSGIYIDPNDANHAWVSFSGFSASTPSAPGHVFEVTFNPVAGTATWSMIDDTSITAGGLGDIPITDIVSDVGTGDLYVSTDFGVFMLANGSSTWTRAADGLPNVEVAGLTIVPGARKLYAATHGRGAWLLNLP